SCTPQLFAQGGPGACFRAALGTGTRGACIPTCTPGVNTCPSTSGPEGLCLPTKPEWLTGQMTATDKVKAAPICLNGPATGGSQPRGTACTLQMLTSCQMGSTCGELNAMGQGGHCEQICLKPAAPMDAGVPDGGVAAGACSTGTCTDTLMI